MDDGTSYGCGICQASVGVSKVAEHDLELDSNGSGSYRLGYIVCSECVADINGKEEMGPIVYCSPKERQLAATYKQLHVARGPRGPKKMRKKNKRELYF